MGMQKQLSFRWTISVQASPRPRATRAQRSAEDHLGCGDSQVVPRNMPAARLCRDYTGAMAAVSGGQQQFHRLAAVLAPRAVPHSHGDPQLAGCSMGSHMAWQRHRTAASASRACIHFGPSAHGNHAVSVLLARCLVCCRPGVDGSPSLHAVVALTFCMWSLQPAQPAVSGHKPLRLLHHPHGRYCSGVQIASLTRHTSEAPVITLCSAS